MAISLTIVLGCLLPHILTGEDPVRVTTQAAAVFELHLANPALKFLDLFRRAMRISQDHMAEELVRTLVGSIGLMLAVPVTTALACAFALYRHRFGGSAPGSARSASKRATVIIIEPL